jgi:hypothetical protein
LGSSTAGYRGDDFLLIIFLFFWRKCFLQLCAAVAQCLQ